MSLTPTLKVSLFINPLEVPIIGQITEGVLLQHLHIQRFKGWLGTVIFISPIQNWTVLPPRKGSGIQSVPHVPANRCTSSAVSNIPTGTDIIALQYAGNQTLTFSQTIANPVFSYVSLNGNGYAFNQDFNILSVGDPGTGKDCGYFGCGTSSKSVVFNPSTGKTEYQLIGTGEPHGTLQFTGAFDTVSWRSLSNEDWNGFTVGIQGTAAEVFPPSTSVPEPFTIVGTLVGGTAALRTRSRLRSTAKKKTTVINLEMV